MPGSRVFSNPVTILLRVHNAKCDLNIVILMASVVSISISRVLKLRAIFMTYNKSIPLNYIQSQFLWESCWSSLKG